MTVAQCIQWLGWALTRTCTLLLVLHCSTHCCWAIIVCGVELWVVYRHKGERWVWQCMLSFMNEPLPQTMKCAFIFVLSKLSISRMLWTIAGIHGFETSAVTKVIISPSNLCLHNLRSHRTFVNYTRRLHTGNMDQNYRKLLVLQHRFNPLPDELFFCGGHF